MTEPDIIDTSAFIAVSPLGHVVIAHGEQSGERVRVVLHADPTIRVAFEWTEPEGTGDGDWLDGDTLVLDTAGEYRYKPTDQYDGDHHRLYVLIGGADDPDAPNHNPHP
jgi:hypothetical protein